MVLILVGFLIGSKKRWVISLPIRNKQGIGVGLTSKSSKLVKSSVLLVSVCVTPSHFQRNRYFENEMADVMDFTLAPLWPVCNNEIWVTCVTPRGTGNWLLASRRLSRCWLESVLENIIFTGISHPLILHSSMY